MELLEEVWKTNDHFRTQPNERRTAEKKDAWLESTNDRIVNLSTEIEMNWSKNREFEDNSGILAVKDNVDD